MEHTSDTPREQSIVRLPVSQREQVTQDALEQTNASIRALEAQTGDLVLGTCAFRLRQAAAIMDLVVRDERRFRCAG